MSRDFEERMKEYVQLLGEDNPPADHHFALRDIYHRFGVVPVDDWLNNYYEKVIENGRNSD